MKWVLSLIDAALATITAVVLAALLDVPLERALLLIILVRLVQHDWDHAK